MTRRCRATIGAWSGLALLTAAALAFGASALPAGALASDTSVTESYLRADLALDTAGHQHLATSIAGYRSVLAKVRSQCPQAAANSPQNSQSTKLSNEVIGTMALTAGQPDRSAVAAYLRAVRGMHWSSGAVTHEVSSYAAKVEKLYKLPIPDLCGDVRGWAASGYRSLPASTVSFDATFLANWVGLGFLPASIARFENGTSSSLARRANAYEQQFGDAEAQAVKTYGSIMDELELNQ